VLSEIASEPAARFTVLLAAIACRMASVLCRSGFRQGDRCARKGGIENHEILIGAPGPHDRAQLVIYTNLSEAAGETSASMAFWQ
jgi:hypothetical protein